MATTTTTKHWKRNNNKRLLQQTQQQKSEKTKEEKHTDFLYKQKEQTIMIKSVSQYNRKKLRKNKK